jgi:hypothetical protein
MYSVGAIAKGRTAIQIGRCIDQPRAVCTYVGNHRRAKYRKEPKVFVRGISLLSAALCE